MSRELSLFADYSQKENRVTNYCGLILKLLFNTNPQAFEEAINNMLDGNQIVVSPLFTQQSKQSTSIPDLQIKQSSYNLFFETKTTDWFYEDQINRHIQGLICSASDVNVLFLLTSEFNIDSPNARFSEIIEEAKSKNIILRFITFEKFVAVIKNISSDVGNNFTSIISEFEEFLNRNNLMPSWKHTLDIVNCGGTKSEIESDFYICPDKGGAYNHSKCKYFGAYWDKNVNYLAEIKAVIVIEQGGESFSLKWKNTADTDKDLFETAKRNFENCEKWRKEEARKYSLQMFILAGKRVLDYRKTSGGGMMCSKRYMPLPPELNDINDVFNHLNKTTWE